MVIEIMEEYEYALICEDSIDGILRESMRHIRLRKKNR